MKSESAARQGDAPNGPAKNHGQSTAASVDPGDFTPEGIPAHLVGKPTLGALRAERQQALEAARAWDPIANAPKPQWSPIEAPRAIFSAETLMATTFPEQRWAVPGILSEGLNLAVGAPKIGKSWLALNLATAVAQGGRALGRIDVQRGDVLYLALEDTARRLQSRLGIVLAGAAVPAGLDFATSCEQIEDGGAEGIGAWLDDHDEARLVIVDVFTRVRGRVAEKTNRYEADYEAMAGIKNLADQHGVAFLVVHHTRKAISEDFLDAVSGTHGLAGAADAVLVLGRSRGSASATLKITGRDIEESSLALDFAPDIGAWQLLDGEAEDYELGGTRRKILQLVRDGGPLTPTKIAQALDVSIDNAKKTVRRMVGDDQLVTDGAGNYFAPLSPVTPVPLSPGDSEVTSPLDDQFQGVVSGRRR